MLVKLYNLVITPGEGIRRDFLSATEWGHPRDWCYTLMMKNLFKKKEDEE